MFNRIGNVVVKNRIWIISGWVLLALVLFFFAPSLSEVGTMNEANFLPRDSESLRARELIAEYFPQNQAVSTATLVFYNPEKLGESDLAYAQEIENWLTSGKTPFAVENVTSIFDNPELKSRLTSPDGTTMLMNVGLAEVAFESESQNTTKAMRNYLASAPAGLKVYVSGQVGVYSDLFQSLNKSISLTTLITLILVIILLILIYRSPVAAMVPLLTIGMAYAVARGVMGLIGQAGVSIWSQIDVFLIVLIFGIGTDYCLFLVSRFREELKLGKTRTEAMKMAVGKIGVVITASAFAVVVGLVGMAVARYQMIQTMGPTLGVAILITLLAALTLAPALASIFGNKLFWPRHKRLAEARNNEGHGLWYRVSRFTTEKPMIIVSIVLVIMLVPYLALPGLNRSFDQLAELPPASESVAGYRILENHYDIGEMEPLTAVIVAPEGQNLTNSDSLNALAQMGNELRKLPSVVKVQSVVQPEGTDTVLPELTVSGNLTAIGTGIASSFSSSNTDPAVLFSSEVTSSFSQITAYLEELAQNFSWIKEENSFQALVSDVKVIQEMVESAKTGALVENQLNSISLQIKQMSQGMTSSDAAISSETIQSFQMIKSYLEELAGKYPLVKDQTDYQEVYSTLTEIEKALPRVSSLPHEQLPALLTQISASIQQVSSGLDSLAAGFKGSNSILFSQVLAQASPAASPLESLKAQFDTIMVDLQSLANWFAQNGNPLYLSPALMSSSAQFQDLANLFYSQDRRATTVYVVLDAYPQSDAALTAVGEVRNIIKSSIEGSAPGDETAVGGTTAELSDVRVVLDSDFTRVMIVVLVAIFIVLALLLRSLVAPVFLLATVLLSYGTTLGIVSWIFQGILGQDGISFMIPIIVFVLLVALGSDYNIFLISRVREESATTNTRMGTRLAVIATGGVITACGIILAGTFGALVTTPIRTLMQIGAAVAIGVLIDTFIVRALLVPSITSLLGRWTWWPSKHG